MNWYIFGFFLIWAIINSVNSYQNYRIAKKNEKIAKRNKKIAKELSEKLNKED